MTNASLSTLKKIASELSNIVEASNRFPAQLLTPPLKRVIKPTISESKGSDSVEFTLSLDDSRGISFCDLFGRSLPFKTIVVKTSEAKSFKSALHRVVKETPQAQMILQGISESNKIYELLSESTADETTRLDLIEVGSNAVIAERMCISDLISVINKKQLVEPRLSPKNETDKLLSTLTNLSLDESGALLNHSYLGFYVREHGDRASLLPESPMKYSHNKIHTLLKKSNKSTTYDVYKGVNTLIGEALLEHEIFELPEIKELNIAPDKVQHQFRYLKDTALFGKSLASRRYYSRYYKHKGFFLTYHGDCESVGERPNFYTQYGYGVLLLNSVGTAEIICDIESYATSVDLHHKDILKLAQDNSIDLLSGNETTKTELGIFLNLQELTLPELTKYSESQGFTLSDEILGEIDRLNIYSLFALEPSL